MQQQNHVPEDNIFRTAGEDFNIKHSGLTLSGISQVQTHSVMIVE